MSSAELLQWLNMGLIFSLLTLGVYLTFRVCDFPDLTVEGSFPLGAAVVAQALVSGMDPKFATLLAMLAGGMAGLCTGLLYAWGRISALLSGIITMIALYSINLRIMGSANLAFFQLETLYPSQEKTGLLLGVMGLIGLGLFYFLNTDCGLALRASGSNPRASLLQGISADRMKCLALCLSNALVALAGALYAQFQGFSDISMGTGVIIIGIASLIMGEAVIRPARVMDALMGCMVGAVLYRVLIGAALHLDGIGLRASDLNLITAVMVAGFMVIPHIKILKRRVSL